MLRWLTRLFALFTERGAAVRKPVVEEVEPRILYSADVNPLLWGGVDPNATAIVAAVDSGSSVAPQTVDAQQQQQQRREIIFIDAAVADAQTLIDGLIAARPPGTAIEVVQLQAGSDGLHQIGEVLASEHDLNAIHIVSHGDDALLQLGSTRLDAATLAQRGDEIAAWRSALDADADLMLYGCDVGRGESGAAFIDQLSQLTGADVAASTDATGASALGGNWVLEAQSGQIESHLLLAQHLEQSWNSQLALTPQGGETRVNTTTTNTQFTTSYGGGIVAMDSAGNYVVVWNDANTNSGDIYFQRYNASGVAQGGNVLVNATTANAQIQAKVAMDSSGNFVVVWNSAVQDGSGTGIYGQRYNASGVAQGGEFRVNTTTAGNQNLPTVAMSSSGAFVVVWADAAADGSGVGVFAQRYNAAGTAQGSEFRVNTTIAGDQAYASAAMDGAGNFVVAWDSDQTGDFNVYVQRYNASGGAQGGEVLVNTTSTGGQWNATVAMDFSGNYVVVWESTTQDSGGNAGVYGQRYNAAGVAQGGEFHVNTTTADAQTVPVVAMNAGGGFIVAWNSYLQDGSLDGVYTQQYDVSGATLGGEVRVATTVTNSQFYPAVAYQANQAIIAWSGEGTGDTAGVFMQRYSVSTPPAITVTPTAGLATTEAGGTAQFNVVLNSAPTATVTIAVSSSDTGEGTVSTSLLTFTTANWATPQTVTVTGIDDALADGFQSYSIVLAPATSSDGLYNTLNPSDVQVANSDNDITYGLITVDTTADTADGDTSSLAALAANRGADGFISLREAIIAANNTANGAGGADRIHFNIAAPLVGGAHTISLASALPDVSGALVIDGTSESDFAANSNRPVVIIDGEGLVGNGLTFTFSADGSTVKGLAIRDFTGNGIQINGTSDNHVIAGNYIGQFDTTGADAGVGEAITGHGIFVGGSGTRIGGTAVGDANLVHAAFKGVTFSGAATLNNSVLGNAIYGHSGAGIDLGDDGVTYNDPGDIDAGANGLVNYPVLESATSASGNTLITGKLTGLASTTFRVEFFGSPSGSGDASGYGEARVYLGSVTVTTDASGKATFSQLLSGVSLSTGDLVTAAATVELGGGNYGSTSEFAGNILANQSNLMLTGSYVGNGLDNRQIIGLGFRPELVIVLPGDGVAAYLRTSAMVGDASKAMTGTTALQSNRIQSLEGDGFTVGTDVSVNSNGQVYHWIAFSAGADIDVGSYTGTGSTQTVSGLGFNPEMVWALPNSAQSTRWESSLSGNSFDFNTNDFGAAGFTGFTADGFTVDGSAPVNGVGTTNYYVAWNESASYFKQATYTGNGVDYRNISGVGFAPELVFVRQTSGTNFVDVKTASTGVSVDATGGFGNFGQTHAGYIRALQSDGFQVSADADENGNGLTYAYFAFNQSNPAQAVNNVPAAQATIEDTNLVFSTANGNAISITDADAGAAVNDVTISVTNGTLTLAGTSGLTFINGDGTADGTMTVRGTAADINSALNGLVYAPTANYNGGAALTITTLDATLVSLNIDASLAGRYEFAGNANDTSPGVAQNGALFGNAAITTDATRGQVLTLDGSGDYVQITGTYGNPTEVTIGGWVNLTSVPDGRGDFITLSDRVHIALDEGSLGIKGSVQTGAGAWTDLPSGQFIAGTGWHHVMYTYSDSGNLHTLYIDGTAVASASLAGSIYWTGAGDTFIGKHPTNPAGLEVNGLIDEVRIYTRALSASEVAALANDLPLTDTDIVAITVAAVNDAPVNTVPGAQSTSEDTVKVFSSGSGNPISIADVDAGGANNQITLSVTNGTLTLAGTAGLTFVVGDGAADATMTLRGTAAAINSALDGLVYAPSADYAGGATLTLSTLDSTLVSLSIDANLQARYTFEATADDVAPGVAQNGTLTNGAAIVSDATRGQVLDLDGVNDYVQISGMFGSGQALTLSGWVNFTGASRGEVFSLGGNVLLRIDDGGGLGVSGAYYDGAAFQVTNSGTFISGTGWHHVAYTIDSASDQQRLYIDGTVVATTSHTQDISYTRGGTNTTIGVNANTLSSHFFRGQIDDARIYNRVLSAAEVATLASDLALTDTDGVAVTVTAVNDAPVISSNGGGSTAAASVAENTTAVTTVTSSDIDGGTAVYSIVAGGDGAQFTIDASTGALAFNTAPDFENPTDTGANNVYDLTVQVADGNGGFDTQTISVTVSDVSNTLVVTTAADTNDSGLGASFTAEQLNASKGADNAISLREALIAANTMAGIDTISFNIAGAGPHTINVLAALPVITDTVIIDGSTDPDFAGAPMVVLNNGAAVQDGLLLAGAASGGSTVRGLVIQNFIGSGINIVESHGNVVAGNWFGLDSAGTGAAGNALGVNVWNSNNNIIGGSTAADRNVISGNSVVGVVINTDNGTSSGNQIRGNYIGTSASGAAAVGNANQGLWINAAGNTIGGTSAGQGNVISGNLGGAGVDLTNLASGTLVAGNLIGLNAAGTAALGNVGGGVYISSANNTVGGVTAAERNVISGNLGRGLTLTGAAASGNVVIGNYVGTDITGTADVDGGVATDGLSGVVVDVGATNNRIGTDADGNNDAAERNVLSGNNWYGLEFIGAGTAGNVAQGNYIGTTATGLAALGNATGGVSFWNGASNNRVGSGVSGAGNVISGNQTGVQIASGVTDNRVQGNLIGLAADGTTALGNSGVGVYFYNGGSASLVSGNVVGTDADGSNDAGERNVISANTRGVVMDDAEVTGNRVAGNFIGTDATGLLDRGNTFHGVLLLNGANANTIGGSLASQRNVISGNNGSGIEVNGEASDNNILRGNWIGVAANGASALGNGGHGLHILDGGDNTLVGGTGANDGNWIASPTLGGIFVKGDSTGTLIQGNRIGTDLAGTANWGSGQISILLENGASQTLVGGTSASAGNIVAFAGQGGLFTAGIAVIDASSTGNVFLRNSVYGSFGLGIDLGNDGVTANDADDADSGANDLLNALTLDAATTDGSTLYVSGSYSGAPNTYYRIDVYSNTSAEPSGTGEGRTWIGAINVPVGASGTVSGEYSVAGAVAAGAYISATVTRTDSTYTSFYETSEFSNHVVAETPSSAPAGSDGTINAIEDTVYTFTTADFGFSDSDGDSLQQVWFDTLPASGTLRWNGTPFAAGNWIDAADITAGMLTYMPASDAQGAALASFTFRVQDDGGTLGGGADTDASANTITINVSAVNDAPLITSNGGGAAAAISVAENSSAVTTVTSTDVDGGAAVYSIAGGADAALFSIDGSTGVLSFNAAPDHESPTDAGGNNVYDVTVQVSDGNGATDTQAIAVTVTNANEAPVVTPVAPDVTFVEGGAPQVIDALGTVADADSPDFDGGVLTIAVTQNGSADDRLTVGNFGAGPGQVGVSGSTVSYQGVAIATLSGGTSGADPLLVSFNSSATQAAVQEVYRSIQFFNVSDTPSTLTRELTIGLTDGDGGASAAQVKLVHVAAVNDAPSITSDGAGPAAAIVVAENQSAVTTVTSSDVDGGAPVYSIAGGADAALFSIDAASGVLTFNTAPDFDAPSDAGTDNVYNVVVQVSDGNGGADTQAIAITVTNVNEAPVITSGAAVSVAENQTAITTVTSTDVDGAAPTYTISGGADAALFSVDTTTGVLTFNTAPNFESPADAGGNNVYDVTVQVADGNGGFDTQAIAITVTNVNETPVITSGAAVSVAENHQTAATTVTSTDVDGAAPTYAISGGADAALFSIDSATGALTFNAAPDFESPSDAGGNNVYDVTVQVADGNGGFDTQAITITVTNVNEAPVITSGAAVSVAENQIAVTTVTSGDVDGAAPTYTISGGADAALFSIDSATGVLTFSTAPNFESPGDAGGNNVYDVTVQVADGNGGVDTQAIAITVTNVNEAPVIASGAAVSVAENQAAVTTVTSSDVDGGAPAYTISGGADAALFSIDSATGVLTFNTAPNFESPSDAGGNNVYDVTVQVADGNGGFDTQAISISVTNVNEAPVITNGAVVSVAENQTAVTTVTSTDVDGGAPTYTISGGADAALFSIDSATGVLTFNTAPNFESPSDAGGNNVYDVTVQVADGNGGFDTQAIAVTVSNANEAPVITSGAALLAAENQTAVTTVTSTDVDGAVPTYTIIGGADAALFSIDSATGVLTFNTAPNFESPVDAGGNNVYDVTVQVADGNGGFVTQAIAITVTNTNEAPVITSGAVVSAAENQIAVTTVMSSDVDGAAPTYTISGGADAGLFSIDSATGVLTFNAAPNFESPADAGGNNIYDVTVQVADGNGGFDTQAIAITVTNVNEAPVITSSAAASVAENQTAVATVTSADVDGNAPAYSIVGGADAADFTIDAASGAIAFTAAPDFEAPSDADLDNVYQLTIGVADGNGGTDTQSIAVAVTGVNEAPGNIAPATALLSEQVPAGTVVAIVTASDPDAGDLFTFTLINDGNGRFVVDPSSGRLTVAAGAVLDFEAAPSHTLVMRVTDAQGLRTEQQIVVTLRDVVEVLPEPAPLTPPAVPLPPAFVFEPPTTPAPALPPASAAPLTERESAGSRGAAEAPGSRGLVGAALAGAQQQDEDAESVRRTYGRPLSDDAPVVVAGVSFTGGGSALGGWSDAALDGLLMQQVSDGQTPRFGMFGPRGSSLETDAGDEASARGGTAQQSFAAAAQDPVRVASATLTAGFVWWLTRSGGLLTSILMGIPAWRHVDLLPVLAPRAEDDDEDDDTGDGDKAQPDARDSIADEMFSNTSRMFGESRYMT